MHLCLYDAFDFQTLVILGTTGLAIFPEIAYSQKQQRTPLECIFHMQTNQLTPYLPTTSIMEILPVYFSALGVLRTRYLVTNSNFCTLQLTEMKQLANSKSIQIASSIPSDENHNNTSTHSLPSPLCLFIDPGAFASAPARPITATPSVYRDP